jgi:hypothetical protein
MVTDTHEPIKALAFIPMTATEFTCVGASAEASLEELYNVITS